VGLCPAGVHPGQGADQPADRAQGTSGRAAPATGTADPREPRSVSPEATRAVSTRSSERPAVPRRPADLAYFSAGARPGVVEFYPSSRVRCCNSRNCRRTLSTFQR
jgi:hypothetical protein